mmetsp:Transcript_23979/g.35646  ORF Transcript_23979/g.35646 Transcript_23979/m.35646 type:complete len:915 (-) Transcript_23979:22-2766(-)
MVHPKSSSLQSKSGSARIVYDRDRLLKHDLGCYIRPSVTNITPDSLPHTHFQHGLRLLLSYQHEEAAQYFRLCLQGAPECALAHALIALCNSPNYNFKGEAYYETSFPPSNLDHGYTNDAAFSNNSGNSVSCGSGSISTHTCTGESSSSSSSNTGDSVVMNSLSIDVDDDHFKIGGTYDDGHGSPNVTSESAARQEICSKCSDNDNDNMSASMSMASASSIKCEDDNLGNNNKTKVKGGRDYSSESEPEGANTEMEIDAVRIPTSHDAPGHHGANLNFFSPDKHPYPSQILADYHSRLAVEKVAELRLLRNSQKNLNRTDSKGNIRQENHTDHHSYDQCEEKSGRNSKSNVSTNRNTTVVINDYNTSATAATVSITNSTSVASNNDSQQQKQQQHPISSPKSLPTSTITLSQKLNKSLDNNREDLINTNEMQQVETLLINAIRCLNCNPGIDPSIAEQCNGVSYKNAMRHVYHSFPNDAEVAYFFAESIMVLHAWKLFEYPTGVPLSEDVAEVKEVLEKSLKIHPNHVGLCHMYVHFCEMAPYPERALSACDVLRTRFPDAGHLLHMPTHIDVLLGDYDACVKWNEAAIVADKKTMQRSPKTSNVASFYFGYISHNYHMLIYGATLGAMEKKAMTVAIELNQFLHEGLFVEKPGLAVYLESYGTMDIHVMVRFGRWKDILNLTLPRDSHLMLYRAACIHYAKAIAYANLGDTKMAKTEAEHFEELRLVPDTKNRILHNNCISDLLDIDSLMIRGEIAFFERSYTMAFECLRAAVKLQDGLNYDEPWGKMQPVRHALGGLLLKRGLVEEAEEVYREDLRRLPKNPWSIKGLMRCLKERLQGADSRTTTTMDHSPCCSAKTVSPILEQKLSVNQIQLIKEEFEQLEEQFTKQRQSEWADYDVTHSCACCISEENKF